SNFLHPVHSNRKIKSEPMSHFPCATCHTYGVGEIQAQPPAAPFLLGIIPNFSGLNPPTITQKLSGISQWVTSLGIQPAPPRESRLARSSASTPSAKENFPRPPSCSKPPAWDLASPNPGATASATTSFSILTASIPITTTPITTILIAKTLTAPILITTTLTTTTPATTPPPAASGASSSSAPKSCAPAVTTSSPSTPSTDKARWFTPPTTLTFLSPTSSRSISGTCSPSRPSRPAKAFASILKADANALASST